MTPDTMAEAISAIDQLRDDLMAADRLIVRLILERHALRQQLAQLVGDQ